jgi:hypothetical protein
MYTTPFEEKKKERKNQMQFLNYESLSLAVTSFAQTFTSLTSKRVQALLYRHRKQKANFSIQSKPFDL